MKSIEKPLSYNIIAGNVENVKILIQQNPKVIMTGTSWSGYPPFHCACFLVDIGRWNCRQKIYDIVMTEAIKLGLEKTLLNSQNDLGETPLEMVLKYSTYTEDPIKRDRYSKRAQDLIQHGAIFYEEIKYKHYYNELPEDFKIQLMLDLKTSGQTVLEPSSYIPSLLTQYINSQSSGVYAPQTSGLRSRKDHLNMIKFE